MTPATATVQANQRTTSRSEILRQRRQEAGVVLADISRVTGYDVRYLIEMESGTCEVPAATYSRVSTTIADLVRQRRHPDPS